MKRKETKKEKRELVQWACTDRSTSLSPPSNLTSFSKTQTRTSPLGQQPFRADSLKSINPHGRIFFLGDYLH